MRVDTLNELYQERLKPSPTADQVRGWVRTAMEHLRSAIEVRADFKEICQWSCLSTELADYANIAPDFFRQHRDEIVRLLREAAEVTKGTEEGDHCAPRADQFLSEVALMIDGKFSAAHLI